MSTEYEQDLQEFIDLRAEIKALRHANARVRQENERLRRKLDEMSIDWSAMLAEGRRLALLLEEGCREQEEDAEAIE